MRFFLILFLVTPLTVFGNLQSILEKANSQELWNDPQWQKLMHYKEGESTIDSPGFFLSEDGKTNPREELLATLRAFTQPPQKEWEEKITIRDAITQNVIHQHPQCQFPARFAWLAKKLNLNFIQKQTCPAYDKWIQKVNPHRVTLVFASAYLNQPSSLFGHTFFRFDPKEKNQDLLSYISNFGAITPAKPNGFSYAYNGLTGGYPGVFSFEPYYQKVKSYGALENRDLWEYHLNLSSEETTFLAQHIWELGYQYVDYYFFTDNCSYLLLELLDVVRPQNQLSEQFPLQAIPLDTVRAIIQKDLVTDVKFRPSLQTKILSHWTDLSGPEKEKIKDFRRTGKLSENPSKKSQARVVEVAYDSLQYDLAKNKMALADFRKKTLSLLRARNQLSDTAAHFSEIQPPIRPDSAHNSQRLRMSIGERKGNEYLSLGWRPAYHTIEDPDDGHIFGAGINFLEGTIHYDMNENDIFLSHFDLVRIQTLTPWQATFKPLSWKLGVKFEHRPTNWERLMGSGFGAIGLTQKLDDYFYIYQMAEGQVSYADSTLDQNPLVGVGGSVGFIYRPVKQIKFLGEAKHIHFLDHTDQRFTKYKFQTIYQLNRSNSFFVEVNRHDNKNLKYNDLQAGMMIYF